MLYTNEMIRELGFDNVDDFVADYTRRIGSQGYCVRYCPDGVIIDYDYDTCLGTPWYGYFKED